jgi:predicted  nucleic acid-binding Zn-ribbon protein
MLEPVRKLLAVQECDIRCHEIERTLRDIPARQKAEAERLVRREHEVADREKALKEAQSNVKQLELEVENRRERVRKLRQQQMEVKTNKEFTAIEVEIKQAEMATRGIEDQELTAMEVVEGQRRKLTEAKESLKFEQAGVQSEVRGLEDRAEKFRSELKDLTARRATLIPDVNPDWMAAYQRISARREPALVPIVDATCGGCHMKLPPAVYHSTRRLGTIATCDFCARLLYSD